MLENFHLVIQIVQNFKVQASKDSSFLLSTTTVHENTNKILIVYAMYILKWF